MVLPDSDRVPRVPSYSGATHGRNRFRLRGYHPLWPAFPGRSATDSQSVATAAVLTEWSYNPSPATPAGLHRYSFGLFRVRSPLLAESLILISFPEGTEMFQFPPFAALRLCIQRRLDRLSSVAVSRFGDRRVDACYTAHRRLSQFYHVLHRLLVPRHPPNALTSLTTDNLLLPLRPRARLRRSGNGSISPSRRSGRRSSPRLLFAFSGSHDFARSYRDPRATLWTRLFIFALRSTIEFSRPAVRARVGQERFELSTPRLSSACSNQLSYWPASRSVSQDRIARPN